VEPGFHWCLFVSSRGLKDFLAFPEAAGKRALDFLAPVTEDLPT
jgi:hypothetical protein